MHNIHLGEFNAEFASCWNAAGAHLSSIGESSELMWLKGRLEPPFLEHLSLRLGNQLFFVRIEAAEPGVQAPGTHRGLESIAAGCRGHACILRMRKRWGRWKPIDPGWGLTELETGRLMRPSEMVTNERIEMTEWELHDFAVGSVRSVLEREGKRIMSSQGNPSVDPSIWFVGASGPEWVVVRAARYPAGAAARPSNWSEIAASCARLSRVGHFASVAVASAEQSWDEGAPPRPLWRGFGMHVAFQGLKSES